MALLGIFRIVLLASAARVVQTSNEPIIDLGYVVQQAAVNSSGHSTLFTFSNIRYGAPPIGDLRFAPPIEPPTANRTINNGKSAVTCPQATPTWASSAYEIVDHLTTFTTAPPTTTSSSSDSTSTAAVPSISSPSSTTSEDCLFLDVVVPAEVYESEFARAQRVNPSRQIDKDCTGGKSILILETLMLETVALVPVLVWLYGGGYVTGDKNGSNNPASLIGHSLDSEREGIIYVAPNYRLGLFGWQASSAFQAQGGSSNVGLLDQRLALEWIQKYIALFGGDPSRITVIGESAGAGSIIHHITAPSSYNTSALFTKAITQSPAFQPITNTQQTITFETTLRIASELTKTNITTLSQLKALPFTVLYDINVLQVAVSEYGTFTFGPVVDGIYVPTLPGRAFLNGSYDHDISVVTSRNANEGAFFTSPYIQDNASFKALVETLVPDADNETITYISTVLYPPIFNGSSPYKNQNERGALITEEFTIVCHSYEIASAFASQTASKTRFDTPTINAWKYYFDVPPGLHGDDILYTFFNGNTSTINIGGGMVSSTVAGVLQDIIINFAHTGTPDGTGVPTFEAYSNGNVFNLNVTALGKVFADSDDNERCKYWQKATWLN